MSGKHLNPKMYKFLKNIAKKHENYYIIIYNKYLFKCFHGKFRKYARTMYTYIVLKYQHIHTEYRQQHIYFAGLLYHR